MAFLTKEDVPLTAATTLHVFPAAAIAAGSGAYGTISTTVNGGWVLGSDMPKGRKLLVTVCTGAKANTPTYLKVCLMGGGTSVNGAGSPAEITSTTTEWQTPAGNTVYSTEIDLAAVTDLTKYYSLGVAVNGSAASDTLIACAAARVLDKTSI